MCQSKYLTRLMEWLTTWFLPVGSGLRGDHPVVSKHYTSGVLPIVGYHKHNGPKIEHLLKPGNQIQLKREPNNKHDRDAIALYSHGLKIGYIPHTANRLMALLLDQNVQMTATIVRMEDVGEERVWVEVGVN